MRSRSREQEQREQAARVRSRQREQGAVGAGAGSGEHKHEEQGAQGAQCARAIGACTMLVAVCSAVEQALQRVTLLHVMLPILFRHMSINTDYASPVMFVADTKLCGFLFW